LRSSWEILSVRIRFRFAICGVSSAWASSFSSVDRNVLKTSREDCAAIGFRCSKIDITLRCLHVHPHPYLNPGRTTQGPLRFPNPDLKMPANDLHRLHVPEIGALFEVPKTGAKLSELIHRGEDLFHVTK
jgi:hypothetical protein